MDRGHCMRCGAIFAPGAVRYVMTVTFVADVDLELPEVEGSVVDEMGAALAAIEASTEEELMNQVYHKLNFIVCPHCKSEFVADPFGTPSIPPESFQ